MEAVKKGAVLIGGVFIGLPLLIFLAGKFGGKVEKKIEQELDSLGTDIDKFKEGMQLRAKGDI